MLVVQKMGTLDNFNLDSWDEQRFQKIKKKRKISDEDLDRERIYKNRKMRKIQKKRKEKQNERWEDGS